MTTDPTNPHPTNPPLSSPTGAQDRTLPRWLSPALIALAGILSITTVLVACQPGLRRGEPPITGELIDEPTVRVRVVTGAASATITTEPAAAGTLQVLGHGQPGSEDVLDSHNWAGTLTLDASRGAISINGTSPSSETFTVFAATTVRVSSPAVITLTTNTSSTPARFDGPLTLLDRSDQRPGTLDAVATVPIERYTAGVIAKELYPNWHPAAYRAQAIAARSYALHQRSRARDRGRRWDLESTTADQVFAGLTDRQVASDAAEATRGQILMIDAAEVTPIGERPTRGLLPLRAYYSSTCGGRPQSAAAIWPTTNGFEFNSARPLIARPRDCPCQDDAPRATWTRRMPLAEFSDRLTRYGQVTDRRNIRNLGTPRTITVAEVNEVGRPARITISDGDSSVTLSSDEFRNAFNTQVRGRPSLTLDTKLLSNDIAITVEGRATGNTITVKGKGFGHGVGLCQFGAQSYAELGTAHESILAQFYPGARLVRRW